MHEPTVREGYNKSNIKPDQAEQIDKLETKPGRPGLDGDRAEHMKMPNDKSEIGGIGQAEQMWRTTEPGRAEQMCSRGEVPAVPVPETQLVTLSPTTNGAVARSVHCKWKP